MRSLFISEFRPPDVDRAVFGAFQRMRVLLDALNALGPVDLLFLQGPADEGPAASPGKLSAALAERWGVRVSVAMCDEGDDDGEAPGFAVRCLRAGAVTFFPQRLSLDASRASRRRAVELALAREPDVILAHRLGAMAPLLLSRRPLPPVILDLDDVEHVRALRMAHTGRWGRRRLGAYAAVPILMWSQRRARALARRTLVCSETDRRRLSAPGDARRIAVLPNAVALPEAPPPIPIEPTLLFLGTYEYRPNADAAAWLLRAIWPRIKRAVPGARLILAGPHPERIRGLDGAGPGVEAPGFVDDLVGLYRRTRVTCCPLRAGAGTRVKILEAAAFGRPMVSTAVGAEGLDLVNGRDLLVENDPRAFARACVDLLREPERCARIGAAARAAVAPYDRASVVATARRLISGALQPGAAG